MPDSRSTPTDNPLNALDTRDITLPRRLWSWLVAQSKKNNQSVDEVIARLIDAYRHPETATPTLRAKEREEAAERQKKGSERSTLQQQTPARTDSSRPQGTPPPSANEMGADDRAKGGSYSAADRLRKASDRLRHLMEEEDAGPSATSPHASSTSDTSSQIRNLLKNNDKLQTLEPPESVPRKEPDEGVSMFDVAANAQSDKKKDT